MPGLSVYVNDEVYAFLLKRGKPSSIGKEWITERYVEEIENLEATKRVHHQSIY